MKTKIDIPKPYITIAHSDNNCLVPAHYVWLFHLMEDMDELGEIVQEAENNNWSENRLKKYICMLLQMFGDNDEVLDATENLKNIDSVTLDDIINTYCAYDGRNFNKFYYTDDDGLYIVETTVIKNTWINWIRYLLPHLPEHIMVPRVNPYVLDETVFDEWIKTTSLQEQVSLLTLLEDMQLDWTDYMASHGIVEEISLNV